MTAATTISAPFKLYRTWLMDGGRWNHFTARKGDVVVCTYPKSGTTWMLRILALLFYDTTEAIPLDKTFPWWEFRLGRPVEELAVDFGRHGGRRAVKSHLPCDGIPFDEKLKYIHVGRDGRDVCLSYHNHCIGFLPHVLDKMSSIGLGDEMIQAPYPHVQSNPADFFHDWLTKPALSSEKDGTPFLSYFDFEYNYWQNRKRENLLFVHYADLLGNLIHEMERVADFLEMPVSRPRLRVLADAASFASMSRDGAAYLPTNSQDFRDGAKRLFNKGEIGRWKGIFREEDVELFESRLRSTFSADAAEWLLHGGLMPRGLLA